MDIAISRTTPCAPIFEVARDGEAEAEAERLPMTTRRIRGARKGAGWISGVRLVLARTASLTQVSSLAIGNMYAAQFALMRGDPSRGKENSQSKHHRKFQICLARI